MYNQEEQKLISQTVKTGLTSLFNGVDLYSTPYCLVSASFYEKNATALNVKEYLFDKGLKIIFRPSSKLGFTTVSIQLPSGILNIPISNKFLRDFYKPFVTFQSSEKF